MKILKTTHPLGIVFLACLTVITVSLVINRHNHQFRTLDGHILNTKYGLSKNTEIGDTVVIANYVGIQQTVCRIYKHGEELPSYENTVRRMRIPGTGEYKNVQLKYYIAVRIK